MVLPTSALAKQKQPVTFTKQSKEVYNSQVNRNVITPSSCTDFDPLDDNITVTVAINEIRALKMIDRFSNPDFYVKVKINEQTFISDVWQNMKYVEQPNWSASCEVPKDQEFVNVTIELWDKNSGVDRLCDISPDTGNFTQARAAELTYSIATGIWWGDDNKGNSGFEAGDLSGYGRLNGCDDNSIYQQDRDCELWFDITQNDYDGDGIPYWVEVNRYNTSPLIDNRGEDPDNDGLPIEYEHKWGCTYSEWHHGENGYNWIYDPFIWENHSALDPDRDGLNNIEEFKTSQWGSDPFRQDIFIELDQMEKGPNGQGSFVPTESFDLIRDSHAKHNIVWHIDDGRLGGGDLIPFKDNITNDDLDQWYWNYFMHGDEHNWRRGIFRWAIIAYNGTWANGFTFGSEVNGSFALDCFLLSSKYHDSRAKHVPIIDSLIRKTFNKEKQRAIIYAGAIMHETGHTLDARAPGVDNWEGIWPWQVDYWRFGPYKSVMNYRYIYTDLIDYSDGSHGKNDYDDWGTIDLTYFNPGIHFQ
jgi:hypothetical protein